MSYSVGTDTGGTFTDTVLINDAGAVTIGKRPSTPPEFVDGVIDSVGDATAKLDKQGRLLADVDAFLYGTTIVVNAIATRKAGEAGILTTQGFARTLSMARATSRTNGFSAEGLRHYAKRRKPDLLVPSSRKFIGEVRERIDWKGHVLAPLDENSVRSEITRLLDLGMESLAVCLLWSFRNDVHERRIRDIAHEMAPDVPVTLSSEIAPKLGEYQRMTTTAYNAAMAPVATAHLTDLNDRLVDSGLEDGQLLVMQGNGGLDRAAQATNRPVNLIGSGPAGGVLGAKILSEAMGLPNVICTDVGGTTFDLGLLVDHTPVLTPTAVVHQHELYLPVVDVVSIGAGGGSIARVDPVTGLLSVGPDSAGARPGPVCYGNGGTEPTVTDADAVLGFIDPDYFLGGSIRLDVEAARLAIKENIADPLGMGAEEAAAAIVEIADNHMADLVRQMTVERGHDPREFSVFLYGGGGPLHGTSYAAKLGARSMVVPGGELASVFSAWGIANADIHHTHEQSSPQRAPFDPVATAAVFAELEQQADNQLSLDGVAEADRVFERFGELRYVMQTNEVVVPIPPGPISDVTVAQIVDAFEARYEQLFGKGSGFSAAGIEWINFRVQAYGRRRKAALHKQTVHEDHRPEPAGARPIYWYEEQGTVTTPIYRADGLRAGSQIEGPAVVELPTTTCAVHPRQRLVVDEYGNYLISNS
ncbi:hydantoinase/oxoprolinase family protein [Rhodococcus sp. LB1]|uniref:hydantoinase/oxoprolinase family protein n=1 Tax=Rhodococcus sp. LB1 TaxID=1807499 RepID=UPI00077A1108|nr:hydantoinase/oxoprolinase family protein [Rhodococcus sp. LB1]KXX60429.1 hypothetical protein AZG88_37570 [Rhodococcus sp. LB1]